MKFLFAWLAKVTGRNSKLTPKEVIAQQLLEPRPLPLGRQEFQDWSDRLISGAMLPIDSEADPEIFKDSQRFALADMIMHLGPTESHKPDSFFIHSLRKFAVNQVADAMRHEIRDAAKARLAAREAEEKVAKGEAPALEVVR